MARFGKSVCSRIQHLNRGMSNSSICAVTSGCYKIETSVSAMHVAGFEQLPTVAQVVPRVHLAHGMVFGRNQKKTQRFKGWV